MRLMDKREAQELLDEFAAALQSRFTYQDWQTSSMREISGKERTQRRHLPDRVECLLGFSEIKAGGAIRVMVSIDDGSLARFIVPLTTSLLISPEGEQ